MIFKIDNTIKFDKIDKIDKIDKFDKIDKIGFYSIVSFKTIIKKRRFKMTKKEKLLKIQTFKTICENLGFKMDRWGNYKCNDVRIKFKKINCRLEKKYSFGWCKVFSKPIIHINEDAYTRALKRIITV